jgi:putative membrane protein
MYVGHHYGLWQTLWWSRRELVLPLLWAGATTAAYELLGFHWLALPWLPLSAIAIAVAFYLGFKNNASYDRLWEARKIWGAIVNASRTWAFSARDLVSDAYGEVDIETGELDRLRTRLVLRHVAWLDALRFQLRELQSWEHDGPGFEKTRAASKVPERMEKLEEQLARTLGDEEHAEVLAQLNPAARLLANQSRDLADLRARGLLDPFGHMRLQELLEELMTQQGKAERIKKFPFPRQYATVNAFFAGLFALLVPLGLVSEFEQMGEHAVWLTVPFAAVVSWVFLTTDKIGEWSENPFEGLANDVPISSMARGIERDIRQMIGQTELPPGRTPDGKVLY